MSFTFYALPSILSSVVMLAILIYVYVHRRNSTGAWQFLSIMVCSIIWSSGYAMSLLSTGLDQKMFWFNLSQIGPDFSPVFWLFLIFEYCGHGDLLHRKWVGTLFIIPVITTILMWTNDWHHLLRLGVILQPLNDQVSYISIDHGPWYILEAFYGYAIVAATLIVIIRFLTWSSSRQQTITLLGAMLLPIIFNLLDVFRINPLKPFGSTSIIFSVVGLILTWGLFRQRLLDITPIARNKVLESIGDGVIVLDEKNRIVDVNPAACYLFDSDCNLPAAFVGKDIREVLSLWPEWSEQTAVATDSNVQLALKLNGERHFFDVTVSSLYDNRGIFVGWVSIFHDITEEKEKNERLQSQLNEIQHLQVQLRDLAVRDPLTDCFNRRYLDEMLSRESSRADRNEIMIGLVMIDLDHFKRVNDTYGHATGDQVLQAVGQLLQQRVRLGDMVCRYGGEEFLIVFPGINLASVTERAQSLCHLIAALQVPGPAGAVVKVTASVGVALYPTHGERIALALEHADQALYSAKNAGRNSVCVWQTPATSQFML
ncbi:MAG: diguanylate cyclase [Anaerolineae bacterium]|nr:diguanylate cyclase [Anaerolineae bacterium]